MNWLRQLRWKLFLSHLIVVVVGVVILIPTVQFFARNPLLGSTGLTSFPGLTDSPQMQIDPAALDFIQLVIEQALLISGFAVLVASVIISLFVSRRIVEPLQELTLVSGRLAQGYYRERTTIRSDDEMANLSVSINQLAEALEKTEQRRLGLITDVSHELRTPLTIIAGYMEGLIDGVIQPEPQIFAMVHHEAVRLKWMTEELALLSRAEAGQLRVEPRLIVVAIVIERVVAQFQSQIASQGLTLELNVANDLPPVMADPDRVEQILINLMTNAVQYSPSGGAITVYARRLDPFVEIGVVDTGIGIGAEHLPHIFERFYRVDKSRARQSGGAGIGLTIARHLVYAHGGEIWAESPGAGQGTAFRFTLPIYETVLKP
ncbi:MAG: HAMP domain-containing protein [Chloroflexi bacterium]|nr:HAMP domain-containing protein [Chloroflexota bacterium]